jgi:hypothetical protein
LEGTIEGGVAVDEPGVEEPGVEEPDMAIAMARKATTPTANIIQAQILSSGVKVSEFRFISAPRAQAFIFF